METHATPSGRILVVEDNPITRKLVGFTLERQGYVVLEAPDAQTAVALMDEGAPDLVLQDLMLPDLDGFELVRRLRECTRGSAVPVLAFSGFLSGVDEARVSAAGFDDMIAKPVEPTRLLQTVAAYLPTSASAQNFGRRRRLVIADDDPVQLKLTCYHLTLAGFRVDTAPDGVKALEIARRVLPSAIVLDVMMPGLDGFEACLAARQSPELRDIPVILMTSTYVEEEDQELARRAGASGFVIRTPDSRGLMEALRGCLGRPAPKAFEPGDGALVAEVEKQRVQRTVRQLERQVSSNARMTQRCAALTAELSVLGAASDALSRHHDIEAALETVLASCFDVAGVSLGALYLGPPNGPFRVRTFGGHAGWDTCPLETFFGRHDLLKAIIASETVTCIPSDQILPETAEAILASGDIASVLVAPLVRHDDRLGAFVMLSKTNRLTDSDLVSFAQGVASQIAQAITLSRAFDKLAKLEARQRALLDHAGSGIFTLDLEGRFLDVNRMGETLLGSTKAELLGRRFIEFAADQDREYAALQLRKAVTSVRVGAGEVHVTRPDGATLTLELTCSRVEASGERLILAIAVDVTERNRLRRQAVLNDKLATMGVLAAGIAHEINNPITYLLGNLELAQTALAEVSPASRPSALSDLDSLLGEAIQGATRVREIVRGLKGFTRVDDDDVGPVNLSKVLDTATSMVLHEFKTRAHLEKQYEGDLPTIVGSSGKLQQVFINLLVNAAHAITEGEVQRNRVQVACRVGNGFVSMDVSDTGKGIPKELLPRIFEPFFTTKPSGVGTGLGLAISHEIVRNHGGELRVQSEVGRGTTFSVVLPLDTGLRSPSVAPGASPATETPRGRVLLIDDDERVLRVLTRMVSGVHDVTPVLGGRAALERIASETFDVIVSDYRMPDFNGADLFRHLQARRPDCTVRFILLSGETSNVGTSSPLPIPLNRFLRKPCTAAQLLEAIKAVLDESRR